MKKLLVIVACFPFIAEAQEQQTNDTSQTQTLAEVVVRAYEQNRQSRDIAAPVSIIGPQRLEAFGSISILPAVNATPGVRMEERSPGSFRLNIRGSSLRSPFGVRNVKIYWNDIPFTDPGGNTYLNQFSFYDIASLEILRGPGSSLYGAGTGGVMLINGLSNRTGNNVAVTYTRGSFAASGINVSASTGNDNFRNRLSYTHQSSDGYREQTGMRRDILTWESAFRNSEKSEVSTQLLIGDLRYETPGGLTKAQYLANPRAARPSAGGSLPGAVENRAAIYQKTFRAGILHRYMFNDKWQNSTSAYAAFSQVRNPAIRNYERRLEPHFGGRTVFSYTSTLGAAALKLVAGAEFQQGFSDIKVYDNLRGAPDSLQTDDEVNNKQLGAFAQGEVSFGNGWIVTAGLSLNAARIIFDRLSVVPGFTFKTTFNNELAPRFSLLKKINPRVSLYASVSKGFSPPTVAELLPSTTVINTGLQAEQGWNYEAGLKGTFLQNRLSIDLAAFYFRLADAITQRRDISGADYFINAGNTNQKGLETSLQYQLSRSEYSFVSRSALWFSHTYHHFRYKNFKQVEADFSGNQLPGVAPHTLAGGIDLSTRPGWYASVHYYQSDKIPLNDANAEFADGYRLLGFKAGYKKLIRRVEADLFISGDNLFNETYSLGNDINAAGNRFYNAAPGINYMAGISLQYAF